MFHRIDTAAQCSALSPARNAIVSHACILPLLIEIACMHRPGRSADPSIAAIQDLFSASPHKLEAPAASSTFQAAISDDDEADNLMGPKRPAGTQAGIRSLQWKALSSQCKWHSALVLGMARKANSILGMQAHVVPSDTLCLDCRKLVEARQEWQIWHCATDRIMSMASSSLRL